MNMANLAAVILVGGEPGNPAEAAVAVCALLEAAGFAVCLQAKVPGDKLAIGREAARCADDLGCRLVLTVGGCGITAADTAPEAVRAVAHREIPAIPQAMVAARLASDPRAMLTRAAAGVRGRCLLVNLPGEEWAARESLAAVLPGLKAAIELLAPNP